MPHVIEEARSGRSTCRTCKQLIEKGAARFGFEIDGYDDGLPQYVWHHLACAAQRMPAAVKDALSRFKGELPDREAIDALLSQPASTKPLGRQYPYAELAPTARSKCIECEKTIDKGALRVAVEKELQYNGMTRMGAAYLHLKCAAKSLGKGLRKTLEANSTLEKDALAELK